MLPRIFGGTPTKQQEVHFSKLQEYSKGRFWNREFTPDLTDGYSLFGVVYSQLFRPTPQRRPSSPLPNVPLDLFALSNNRNCFVWFGHSSYWMLLDGVRYLVDPVFSDNASPIPNSVRAFEGSNRTQVQNIPPVDYLIITHDHYDHLDDKTIVALKPKVQRVICGLGVGAHLQRWGYDTSIITEMAWGANTTLSNGAVLYCETARHFSGRFLRRNNTLWASYILRSSSATIYIGGDSGYGAHYKTIGDTYHGIDLAFLDNGQHDPAWRAIHMFPEEVLAAANDLRAKRFVPVHSCKFVMANHEWNAPLANIARLYKTLLESTHTAPTLLTPMIGQVIDVDADNNPSPSWWESVKV
jgi:L-ascorbate metabolism protein UlaG (beta-lactamase superfamily)